MDKFSFSSRLPNAHTLKRIILNNIRHVPRSDTRLARQNIDGPVERAAVARDAEYYLGLDHLDAALMQLRKIEEIWGMSWG